MTLRLRSSKLLLLLLAFFLAAFPVLAFWHTASIKAFKMQSNASQSDRQAD